ncbi:MAG: alpha-L-rhamnosidase C-terminal domain-containing protein, partial [Armatimonadota bacterium]
DPQRGVYADAMVEGSVCGQVSQQINTLAILAGVCPPHRRREVLERVLSDDPAICRCSPYFWLYQFEAMAMAGMHREMLAAIRELWGAMADAGATTWWETFGGDELDSLCHPWSSAPNHVLQKHLLGVQCAEPGFTRAEIRPRPDLLPAVEGSVCTVRGEIEVQWEPAGGASVRLQVRLPEGVTATLAAPEGWRFETGEEFVELAGGAMVRASLGPL